jgi:hypothetical protein
MAISTNGTIITRLAGALYGEYLSNASYTELSSTAPATVAANFLSNDFAGKTDLQVANTILTNLGLTSITGLNNWLAAQLTAAGSTAAAKGATLVSILNGYAGMTADATYGSYATSFNAKTAASLTLSQTTGSLGGSFATADAVAVKAQTITLTAGTDVRAGGSGNDTFDAGLSISSLQTLNSGDRLDGGEGTDELFAVVTGTVTPASIASIENVSVTAITNAATVDLTNATGLKSYTNLASTVTQTTTGVSMATAVTVADTTVDQTVTFAGTSGSSDAVTIGVRNVVNATADSLTVAGIETLTLDVSGTTNTLGALSSAAAGAVTAGVGMTTTSSSSINVIGSFTTNTLGTLGSTVRTLDASKATGSVTAQFSSSLDLSVTGGAGNDTFHLGSAAGVDTVSGGAGNDTVRFSANWTTADIVDGGDGTDTIEFTTAADVSGVSSAPTSYKTTGFETVAVLSQLANATYVPAFISSTAVRFNITGRTAASGVNESTAAALTTGAPTITGPAGTFTVGLGNASQSTNALGALAHALTVNDTGIATTDVLTIANSARVSNGAQVGVYGNQNIVIGGYETVTIDTGSISGTYQNLGTVAITGDLASDTTLKFSGANSVEVDVITATNVDASGITAAGSGSTNSTAAFFMVTGSTARNVTGSAGMDVLWGHGTLGSTISGGAGNDSITGGTLNDSILGGDGDDSINGGAGNSDLIDGGAGNDTITISANANLTELDTVSGGEGAADTLEFTAAITSSASTFQTITGFETLKMAPAAASTISMSDFVNNQGFTRVDYGNAGGNAIALNNAPLSVANIRLISGVDGDSVTFDRLIDNSTNAVTITARGSGTATVPTLTIDDEETVTFTSFASTDDTTITNAPAAADLKSLTVTGSGDLIAATAATSTLIATVDASTSTGAVTLNFGNAAVAITANGGAGVFTFTGGAVGDNISGLSANDVLDGGLGADTINGGAGDDAITGGAGADVMNVGSGTDTIVLGAGTSSTSYGTATGAVATSVAVTGADVITGMAAGDLITFTASANGPFDGIAGAANGKMVAAAATNATLAANAGNLIRGSWVAGSTTGSGTFVVNTAAGADTLYVYDSDAAQATQAYQAIVLVGTVGVGGTHTHAGGVITLTLS